MLHINTKHKLYPKSLKQITDPPNKLFIEGDIERLIDKPMLAVVGSRKASPYGREVTENIVKKVASRGVVIVSGLALGIDSIAHSAALVVGRQTIAMLPCGLDEIYPRSHSSLAKEIIKKGGVILSEYTPKTPAFKTNFIARNRIIAGLSQAVLIAEAAQRSGSL
jgi:DNA processing protein